jgi:PKD repeat protein
VSRLPSKGICFLVLTGCAAEPTVPFAAAGADRFVDVGERVVFDAGNSVGTGFRWRFGDGGEAEGESVIHGWADAGRYTVTLEVTGAGAPDTDSLSVVVLPPGDGGLRVSSAPLAVLADGLVAVAMPDFGRVAYVDVGTTTVLGWVEVCGHPVALASLGDGARLLVACDEEDSVALVSPLGVEERWSLPHGSRPMGVVPWGGGVAVAAAGPGLLLTLDDGVSTVITTLYDARNLLSTGDLLFAARFRGQSRGEVLRVAEKNGESSLLTLAPDPGPDSDTTSRGVPTQLGVPALSPDGGLLAVPGLQANTGRGLVLDGLPMTHETTARATLRLVDVASGVEQRSKRFDDRDRASAAVFSPRGEWIYVAHQGAEIVDVLDRFTLQTVRSLLGVEGAPDAVVVTGGLLVVSTPLARTLRVYDADPAAEPFPLSVIDLLPPGGEVVAAGVLHGRRVFHRAADPRMSRDAYLSCASCHPDGESDGATWDFTDRGEGLRNTIPLRGRAGIAHGPLHWSANFDEVQDFENDIRGPMAGAGFLAPEDWAECAATLGEPKAGRSEELDALAAYLDSLVTFPRSPYRTVSGDLTPEAVHGQAIFASAEAGCVACHPPPDYTDSSWVAEGVPLLHDVGTLTARSGSRLGGPLPGLDTPTLRGVFATAPYLHDGSAATLRDVLTRDPGGLHGQTAHLSELELDALEQFLLQLE